MQPTFFLRQYLDSRRDMDGTTKQSTLGSQRSRVECVPEVAEEDHWEPREEEGLGGGPVEFTAEGPAALRKPPARHQRRMPTLGRSGTSFAEGDAATASGDGSGRACSSGRSAQRADGRRRALWIAA